MLYVLAFEDWREGGSWEDSYSVQESSRAEYPLGIETPSSCFKGKQSTRPALQKAPEPNSAKGLCFHHWGFPDFFLV
jgi:hypothetical protein